MNEPIAFSEIARAFWVWLASPTTVILLSLSYFAFTLARLVSRASERKDDSDV